MTSRTFGSPFVAIANRSRCSASAVSQQPAQSMASATAPVTNASGKPRMSHVEPGNPCWNV